MFLGKACRIEVKGSGSFPLQAVMVVPCVNANCVQSNIWNAFSFKNTSGGQDPWILPTEGRAGSSCCTKKQLLALCQYSHCSVWASRHRGKNPPLFRRQYLIRRLWNHSHINLVQKVCATVIVGRDIGTRQNKLWGQEMCTKRVMS